LADDSSAIVFGTDGWRGLIAEDFTFANVRVVAAAIANYVHHHEDASRGVCIGWDTRFLSENFAVTVAETLAASGIPVKLADRVTPTPALSFAVRDLGAAGGVMITSSHNPAQWNGVKFKASYGGSGSPAIMTAIAGELGNPLRSAAEPESIERVNFVPGYVAAISAFVDLPKIASSGYKFGVDCMYGAGRQILAGLFQQHGIAHVEIRGEINPTFGGVNPEPIEPHIRALQQTVVRERCSAGFATDGDADRIGAVDEHGNFVDAHKILSIILLWLLEKRGWPGDVARAFNTTSMLDRIAALHGRKLHEVGIGFKYICDLMLQGEILIGGEESGGIGLSRHLPERDGVLNALILAGIMAEERKTLAELVADVQARFGEHHYGRVDLHLSQLQKESALARLRTGLREIGGMKVLRTETLDGFKMFVENPEATGKPNAAESWLMLRASGTEPLLRVYSESCSPQSVKALLQAGRAFATQEDS
jgi:alpha-D-glucose phosphate-specific phosphoglucomutase